MNWNLLKSVRGKQLLGAIVMVSLVTPAVIYADASNPVYAQKKKAKMKAKPHKRTARAKPAMREVAVQQPAPAYTPPPEPAYTPPPAEAPAPAPVYSAPVQPAPPPAAPVATGGGSGVLLAVLGAAAVVGGIVLVADAKSP